MNQSDAVSFDPAPEQEWEVWYRDMFDRECPPSVEVSGRGLVGGLIELWARYLLETVRPEGQLGFSRFHLRRENAPGIQIDGDITGALRLRGWIAEDGIKSGRRHVEQGDRTLLTRVAVAHAQLALAGRSGAEILAAAAGEADRDEFERQLADLNS